jgi:hypothetical protein
MKKLIAFVVMSSPFVAFAATTGSGSGSSGTPVVDINSLATKLTGIGTLVTYLLVALAVIFIVWNVVMFMVRADDPEGRGEARSKVIWGIVGLAIILSIWGLVGILTRTFSTQAPSDSSIPSFGSNGNTTNGGTIPGANGIPNVP